MDSMTGYGSLSLGSRLKRLSDHLVQEVKLIYQETGIDLHPSCFPLFFLLHQEGAKSVTEAAEALGVSHPAVSKQANRLLREGWIDKHPDPQDERRQTLCLTARSQRLIREATPVWGAIRGVLDQWMSGQELHFLHSLNEFEALLQRQRLSSAVLEHCRGNSPRPLIQIIPWHERFRADFERLNRAWLDQFFPQEQTDKDEQALTNPESFYLSRGGYIFLACDHQQAIGSCALERRGDEQYQLCKLCVEPGAQGQGVGRRLVLAALDKARQLGAKRVSLETSSRLSKALHLYEQLGFRHFPPPGGRFEYPRTDLYLQLDF